MPDTSEQRRSPRYPAQLPFLYKLQAPASSMTGVGWTNDLSGMGACVELAERIEPRTGIRVRLRTTGGHIEAEAQVVWVATSRHPEGGIRHGMVFAQIPRDHLSPLNALLCPPGAGWRPRPLRVPIEVSVSCLARNHPGPPLRGWTGNVSRGGVLLRLPRGLASGTMLELTLYPGNGPIKVEGEVVWAESRMNQAPGRPIAHGVRFPTLGWFGALALGLLMTVPS